MLDDKRRNLIEQEMAFICEVWPKYLKNYHAALLVAGFNKNEALELTRDFQDFKLIGMSR